MLTLRQQLKHCVMHCSTITHISHVLSYADNISNTQMDQNPFFPVLPKYFVKFLKTIDSALYNHLGYILQ